MEISPQVCEDQARQDQDHKANWRTRAAAGVTISMKISPGAQRRGIVHNNSRHAQREFRLLQPQLGSRTHVNVKPLDWADWTTSHRRRRI